MWIKLITPKSRMRPMDSAFKQKMAPPLSLLVLGALTPPDHRVTIADENVEGLDLSDRPDLVGISVRADTAPRAWVIARTYQQKGVKVVVGGIYPTTCPEECQEYADACVVGEAEGPWPEVLRDALQSRLKRVYRNERAPDLSRTPVPRWELLDTGQYLYTNTLTIGRGCPWRCGFCDNSSPNIPIGYRIKPVDRILKEIASLGTRHVMSVDDNFIANPARARRLLQALIPLGLTWHTAVSADIGRHEDIMQLMAESCCQSLFIGFESLDPENLRSAAKHQNIVTDYHGTISAIHSHGMMVNASLVLGFDRDGPDVFDSTREWLIDNKVDTVTAHVLTPYPGTAFHSQLAEENRILDTDLTHYNTSCVVFQPRGMTAAQLEAGYLGFYDRFYSWDSIRRYIPSDRGRYILYLLFNVFYRKYGRMCSALRSICLMRSIGKLGVWLSYPSLRTRRVGSRGILRKAVELQAPTEALVDSAIDPIR